MEFGEPREPEPTQRPVERRGFRLDFTLTFFLALIALIIAINPPQTPISMGIALALFFLVGVYPLLHFITWLFRLVGEDFYYKFGLSAHTVGLALLVIGVAAWGHTIWPPIPRHILNDHERASFEEPLKRQTADRYEIQLSCPSADENVCTYAAQFINLFREAGWKVNNNQIARVTLGVPYEGIRLFSYVPKYPAPDAPVDSGVWTRITPSLISVYKSFSAIGIEADQGIRNDVPDHILTIYFGPEKRDESTPTDLTKLYKRFPAINKEYPEAKLPQ